MACRHLSWQFRQLQLREVAAWLLASKHGSRPMRTSYVQPCLTPPWLRCLHGSARRPATGRLPCHMHSRQSMHSWQSMQSATHLGWLCSQHQPSLPTPAWPWPASPHNKALAQRSVVRQLEAPCPVNPGHQSAAYLASLQSSHPSEQPQHWLLLSLP